MRAAWWWIDRWRKSSAYTGLTLAEQGAYRNLLDELWLRGGCLPDDDRILGNISGDAREWPKVRKAVMAHFTKRNGGSWHNQTHDEVQSDSRKRAAKQARYRNKPSHVVGNVTPSPSPSPSPSLDQSPDQSPSGSEIDHQALSREAIFQEAERKEKRSKRAFR